jgi:prolipoprotein diacylglyceryltransferase
MENLIAIPFRPQVFNITLNIHLILEYLAFFIAFRYYVFLKKNTADPISKENRMKILLGAIVGAFIGSRLFAYLENPVEISTENLWAISQGKTIMGGLFGGLLGVEWTKKRIGVTHSSGDLFTFPLLLGIVIGRIGCFLSGTLEATYGTVTKLPWGMNLGDGLMRHPIALYEIVYLILLAGLLLILKPITHKKSGLQFKLFMLCYFGFRFGIEYIKPNIFYIWGMSSIQWLCISCCIYYYRTIIKGLLYARKKVHLL